MKELPVPAFSELLGMDDTLLIEKNKEVHDVYSPKRWGRKTRFYLQLLTRHLDSVHGHRHAPDLGLRRV